MAPPLCTVQHLLLEVGVHPHPVHLLPAAREAGVLQRQVLEGSARPLLQVPRHPAVTVLQRQRRTWRPHQRLLHLRLGQAALNSLLVRDMIVSTLVPFEMLVSRCLRCARILSTAPRDKLIAGILVKIVTDASGLSYQSGMYDDSRGEVREVSASGQSCKVLLDTGATIDEVPVSCVEPIRPRNMRETCIVTSGLWTGRKVVTLSNDGGEWMCTLPDGSSGVLEGGQMALAA